MQASGLLLGPTAAQARPTTAQATNMGPTPPGKHCSSQQALKARLGRYSSSMRGLYWCQGVRRSAGPSATLLRLDLGCPGHGSGCAGLGFACCCCQGAASGWTVASAGGQTVPTPNCQVGM